MYINRGLIETAESEAQLAGVMAHEIAHVALRHGTNQASKAYLGQAGFSVLRGLLGGSGTTGDIIGAIGGFGLNAVFLKFSRTAERQADIVGAQTLAKAGYDPMAIAEFFQMLQEKSGRDPSALEEFFSSHPPPEDRAQRVKQEATLLNVRTARPIGGFSRVKSDLRKMPKAPSMQELSRKR